VGSKRRERRFLAGERVIWSLALFFARALAALVFAVGFFGAASSVVFVFRSVPGRGHVVGRSSVTTDYPVDSRTRGLHFVPVTVGMVEIAYVERDGSKKSAIVPEWTCWRVNEQDVPIRYDAAAPPHIRVDTPYGLWGDAALKLFVGAAIFAVAERLLK